MCGVSFVLPSIDSVLNRFIPPKARVGSTAMPITTNPIPPKYCSIDRHSNIEGGRTSRLFITVAPVVDRDETDSKRPAKKSMSSS